MGFAERLARAAAFEDAIIDRLSKSGFTAVDRFGQAQLPEQQRQLLKRHDTAVRWLPDIIAQRFFLGGFICLFIDAKTSQRYLETGRHDIETRSLDTLIAWKQFAQLPVFIVTEDWRVHEPEFVKSIAVEGFFNGIGSGTPFVLWPVSSGHSWEEFFDVNIVQLLAR